MNTISIGLASLEDVDTLVALHYRCFTEQEHIALRFGRRFIIAAYTWFITSPKTFVLVVRQGGEIVGFQSVSEGPYDGPMLLAGWRAALLGLLARPWLVFHPVLIQRLISTISPKEKKLYGGSKVAYLAFVGVDPRVRGNGIGKTIIRATIEACRSRGMKAILTGVKKDNVKSIRMLEASGLRIAPELETKGFVYLKKDLRREIDQPLRMVEGVV